MISLDEKCVDKLIVAHGKRADIGAHMLYLLKQFDMRQPIMGVHVRFVGIYAYLSSMELGLNPVGALFMAIGHDAGKLLLPDDLFSGRNITHDEFALIKSHAYLGYQYWKKHHLLCAIAAGAHHAMYQGGYGIDLISEAPEWVRQSQNLIDLIMLISVVDYIEAYLHRPMNQFNHLEKLPLERQLIVKYPSWGADRIRTIMEIVRQVG